MNREYAIDQLKRTGFDLLVIGGGITGCGIALDAATRGLTVALVERDDFASGTSSRSTKLIHGGLRYLKQWDFKLVNEVGRERAIVHRIAPHLVHPDKMLLPLVKGGKYGYWLTNVGLTVYDMLAGVGGGDRRQMLNKEETSALEPLLRTDILEGGGFYAEYRTDDARLVISVLRTALMEGVIASNYLKVEDFVYDNEQIRGVQVIDTLSDESFKIKAQQVVNATGPWVDELRAKANALHGRRLFLSKGVHLVVSRDRFPLENTVYFDNTDGRMLFAVPRNDKVYLGTTDTPYEGDIATPEASSQDIHYILDAVNHMFPSLNLKIADIESLWAGLRPLIFEEGKGASEMSRKDETFESHNGLISIAGGKLTGYRKMAERVVDLVHEHLKRKDPGSCTESVVLAGGDFGAYAEVENLIENLTSQGLERTTAVYFVHNYGSDASSIIRNAASNSEEDLIKSEVEFCLEHEMIQRALDFLERRTGRLNFNIQSVVEYRETVVQAMAEYLSWNQERVETERKLISEKIKEVTKLLHEPLQ